jgi:hypothetical protein
MMSPDEERQVMAFMKDKPAMLKALKTGTPLKLVK